MKMTLVLERLDKDYRLLERREIPSKSFVKGFINLLYVAHAQIASGAPYSMPDITNAARNIDSSSDVYFFKNNLKVGSAPGAVEQWVIGRTSSTVGNPTLCAILGENLGIVVGIDAGGPHAVTPTDYALQTKVAHGRGAGQLEYGGCELVNLVIAATSIFTIRRYFTNLSGNDIIITEAGIYAAGTRFSANWGGESWPFCIARDLVGPAVTVHDTELLRVQYVPSITV
jgi:hypothetical protein